MISILSAVVLALAPGRLAVAQSTGATVSGDQVIVDMREAYQRRDQTRLAALLPLARGHALEPWAAYWELRLRLAEASEAEVKEFLARYPNTYQEDRLRNDWLLLAGKQGDWTAFAAEYPNFRMADDPELRCYATAMLTLQGHTPDAEAVRTVHDDWLAQRGNGAGCLLATGLLYQRGLLPADVIWRKARMLMETGRMPQARMAAELASDTASVEIARLDKDAMRFLVDQSSATTAERQALVVLALIRLARDDPDQTAAQLRGKWAGQLSEANRDWAWAVIGKRAVLKRLPNASVHFAQVADNHHLDDDLLAWKARAALNEGRWAMAATAIRTMSIDARQEPIWTYWLARAMMTTAPDEIQRIDAQQLLQSIADGRGFYAKLAREALGQAIAMPPPVPALAEPERQAMRQHPGLQRAILAIELGLHSEGTREWNYWIALHEPGGMSDRQLHAAADLACQHQIWDRCINTSERIRGFDDFSQRFPTPHLDRVLRQSQAIGLDPAYVYGLIRQESRFALAARSHVGASGLMQLMPDTARWTARKIGLDGFRPSMINELDTNILLGTHYLKLALEQFGDSLPLAAAAYNAGPGRPRVWREGPVQEAAIWIENVPFGETRNYIQQVLSNTVDYATLLTGKPQSLLARLGTVGPAPD